MLQMESVSKQLVKGFFDPCIIRGVAGFDQLLLQEIKRDFFPIAQLVCRISCGHLFQLLQDLFSAHGPIPRFCFCYNAFFRHRNFIRRRKGLRQRKTGINRKKK